MTSLINRLAALRETPIAPAWAVPVATGRRAITSSEQAALPAAYAAIEQEAAAVHDLAQRLAAVPPRWPASRSVSQLL